MVFIQNLLKQQGIKDSAVGYLSFVILIIAILLVCILIDIIMKKIVIRLFTRIIRRNKHQWADILLQRKVFHRLVLIIPAIIVFISAPLFEMLKDGIRLAASTYILLVTVLIINSILDAINDIYRTHPVSKVRPIKGLLQVVKIVVYIIIGIVTFANLMGQNPLVLISGIGALAAVFSFVFKDSILGFIAGIQLTSNDMLRIGDWIEMPKYGADGDVIDITLNTVKVQNFDKTIVTIPAYALVSDSFKNWRGMTECGGRRIKRSLFIDVNSIRFCTPEMLERFKRINYLKDYMIEKEAELTEYNKELNEDAELLINGRHMTNIGTFRAYIEFYLKHHPELHEGMIQIVRQLPPEEHGLPLEIYAFTKNTDWVNYEGVQADIFDHIFSVAEEFGLRIFQNPTGYDVKQISSEYRSSKKLM